MSSTAAASPAGWRAWPPRLAGRSSSSPRRAAKRTSCRPNCAFFAGAGHAPWNFPDRETLPYDPFSPHPDIVSQRLRTLAALPRLRQGLVVTTQAALLDRLPPRQFLDAHAFALAPGDRLDLPAFRSRLTDAGYVQVTQVLSPGEFAVRGSVVDLFAAGASQPFRLDLFDDRIESIRSFDPSDQRSAARQEAVSLLPAREFPTSAEAIAGFRSRWRERFEGDPQQCAVYRAVTAGIVPAGIEAWLPLFFEATTALTDHLPAGSVIVDLADLERSLPLAWAEVVERHEQRRHDLERPLLAPAEAFVPGDEDAGCARLAAARHRHGSQGRTAGRRAALREFRQRTAAGTARRSARGKAAR